MSTYDCATYPAFDAGSTTAPPAYHIPSVYDLRACVAAPNELTAACCSGPNIGYGGLSTECGWAICVTDDAPEEFEACLKAQGAAEYSFSCSGKASDPPVVSVTSEETTPSPPTPTPTPDPTPTPSPTPTPTPDEPSSAAPPSSDHISITPTEEPETPSPSVEPPTEPSSSAVSASAFTPSSSAAVASSPSANPLASYTPKSAPPPVGVHTSITIRTVSPSSSSTRSASASATPSEESSASQRAVMGVCVVLGAVAVLASLQ